MKVRRFADGETGVSTVAEICPICGEEIVLGACPGCGFESPDLSEIAAPYDLDPSNDHFGEADSVEGMFPQIDTVGIADEPEYDIPSIAIPSIPPVNPAGKFASVGIQPAPSIRVRPAAQTPSGMQSVQSIPSIQPIAAANPAANVHTPPPVQSFQPTRSAQVSQTAQAVQTAQTVQNQQNASSAAPFVPYVQQVQQMQQASLPVRIVKGTVNFVIAHWWKFLIMAVVPSAGLLFMGYYIFQFRTDRHTSDVLKAIMFGVLAGVMMINRWDPFGLDIILRELLDIIFGDRRRRRRRGYY